MENSRRVSQRTRIKQSADDRVPLLNGGDKAALEFRLQVAYLCHASSGTLLAKLGISFIQLGGEKA
jgi:predicted subunit of tRNA(5-methylaminomethyl-2-thiouridylate) methyltransferase